MTLSKQAVALLIALDAATIPEAKILKLSLYDALGELSEVGFVGLLNPFEVDAWNDDPVYSITSEGQLFLRDIVMAYAPKVKFTLRKNGSYYRFSIDSK